VLEWFGPARVCRVDGSRAPEEVTAQIEQAIPAVCVTVP